MAMLYHYDADTKVYKNETAAIPCPETGVALIPAHATLSPLPSALAGENEAYMFDGEHWVITPDYRGRVFYKADGSQVEIEEISVVPDDSWTQEPPSPSDDEQWAVIRAERDRLLQESDWTQGLDAPLSVKQRLAWAGYRKALRDITDDFEKLQDVEWPYKP